MKEKPGAKNPLPPAKQKEISGPLSLDHGVPSLVAQDNPDDSQLGAPNTEGKGAVRENR